MNLLLTFVWVALTGQFIYINFIFGFFLSYFIMWLIKKNDEDDNKYFKRIPLTLGFIGFFLKELVKANIQVAYDVITPTHHMKPAIVAIPLTVTKDSEITTLANLISLTPGTLSLDVSDDKKVLYVHTMYAEDRESFIKEIKEGFEKRIIEIFA